MWTWKYLNLIIIDVLALIVVITVFGVVTNINLNKLNNKIDKLIELSTPEAINVIPENYIL